MSDNKKNNNRIPYKFLLKTIFVVALLYFLIQKGFISIEATRRAFTQWDKLLIALCCTLVTTTLSIIRWQKLLVAHDIRLNWNRTTQLTFIGNFFNIALPGAISGDFVKAFYVGIEVHGQRSRAFGSILFDRVAGVSGLVFLSACTLILGFKTFWGTYMFHAVQFFIGTAALIVLAFFCYLFLVREHHDPLLRWLRNLQSRYEKMGLFTKIYEGVRHYHNHRFVVTEVLVISVIIHIIVSYSCLTLAHALGETQLSLVSLFAIVPLGLLITAIPILPAGVGTGHAAFLALFHLIGSQRGADVYSLFSLYQIFMGAIGGVVYLKFRASEPAATLEAISK